MCCKEHKTFYQFQSQALDSKNITILSLLRASLQTLNKILPKLKIVDLIADINYFVSTADRKMACTTPPTDS